MPVQKGKRNRHRPRGRSRPVVTENGSQSGPTTSARPVQRTRGRSMWQGPPWFNAALGIFMLVAGVVFFALPQKGVGIRDRALFLVAYVVLAGFYLVRAYRGYRSQPR